MSGYCRGHSWAIGPIAVACLACPILSAADEVLLEDDFLGEIPRVTAATRREQRITDTPASVTIISREMIEAQGALNLADILRLVPGYQAYHVNSGWFGVTSHGLSDKYPRRLEVRVDNRSVYTPINSSVSWESLGLTPEDISHIEVVRGSNVPAYGANAILGAVNIVTRNPVQSSGTEIKLTSGSWETRNVAVRQSFTTRSTNTLVRAAYKDNNGFNHVEDDVHIGHVVLQSVYTPDLHNTVSIDAGYSDANIGFGDGDRLDEFASEYIENAWLGFNWEYQSARQQVHLNLAFNGSEYNRSRKILLSEEFEVDPSVIPLIFPGQEDFTIEAEDGMRAYRQANMEVEHFIDINGDWDFLWGLGLRHEELKSPKKLGDRDYKENFVQYLFANSDWHLGNKWVFTAGFMWEDYRVHGSEVSPRAALLYHPTRNHHLRISASEAYRAPSLYEAEHFEQFAFPDGQEIDRVTIAGEDLDAERVKTYELAYVGYWFNGHFSTDLKLFREFMDGGIDHQRTAYTDINDQVRRLRNTVDWRISGYDTQLQWKPGSGWMVSLQYSNVRIHGTRQRVRSNFQPFVVSLADSVPKHTSSWQISRRWRQNWMLAVSGYHQSYTDWRDGTEIDSWTRHDLRLSKTLMVAGAELELGVTVQNLLDEEYLEYQNSNLFPRLIFATAALAF